MNRMIYDCEIVNAIPTGELLSGIVYCNGWHDFDNMGISVIAYQFNNDPIKHCLGVDTFREIIYNHEENPYTLIGFNSKSFDDKLLAANNLEIHTHYDLLEEIRIAAGFEADYSSVPKGFSYRLDAIAQANGAAKTGHGALAPVLWQQDKRKDVIDYCMHDVAITSMILDLGLAGELIDPNTDKKLQLRGLLD